MWDIALRIKVRAIAKDTIGNTCAYSFPISCAPRSPKAPSKGYAESSDRVLVLTSRIAIERKRHQKRKGWGKVSSPRSWNCDGVPKDGKEYPNSSGPHATQENYGPDCVICGLPKEAMQPSKTKVSGNDVGKPPLVPIAAAIALMLLVGGGGWWYVSQQNKNETDGNPTAAISVNPLAIVSDTAINARLISQGEKILLTGGRNFQEKTAAAALFAQGDWNGAIREYQVAANRDPNDPEAKIYLNNAKAKESGNPVAMAVVAPITPRVNEAKEVLRGVAQYQEEYNREFPNRLLEVVVVNEEQASIADSLAQDIINAPLNVLGVLGHGVSNDSRQAPVSCLHCSKVVMQKRDVRPREIHAWTCILFSFVSSQAGNTVFCVYPTSPVVCFEATFCFIGN